MGPSVIGMSGQPKGDKKTLIFVIPIVLDGRIISVKPDLITQVGIAVDRELCVITICAIFDSFEFVLRKATNISTWDVSEIFVADEKTN